MNLAGTINNAMSWMTRWLVELPGRSELALGNEQIVFRTAECSKIKFCPALVSKLRLAGKLTSEDEARLCLGFEEALSNAIEHGNLELQSVWRNEVASDGKDRYSLVKSARIREPEFANRTVTIDAKVEDGALQISIANQGPGFEAQASLEKLLKCSPSEEVHGRGLILINAIFDEVRFSDHGRRITMLKKLR